MEELDTAIKKLESDKQNLWKTIGELEGQNKELKIQNDGLNKDKVELSAALEDWRANQKILERFKNIQDLAKDYGDIEEKLEKVGKYEGEIKMLQK